MGGELGKSKVVPFAPNEPTRSPERSRPGPESGSRRTPSANNCKPYVRKRLAQALPEIADALIEKAQQGGFGQPGRLHALEHRLGIMERAMQRVRGVAAAFGVIATCGHMLLNWIGAHR